MVDAFVGQLSIIAGTYAPEGWLLCDGTTLAIQDYQILYAVLGPIYGGDGYNTFKLPDLRDRLPNHRGSTFLQGWLGGSTHTHIQDHNLPSHKHTLTASNGDASESIPTNNVLSTAQSRYPADLYNDFDDTEDTELTPSTLQIEGGSQPLTTMPPYTSFNFVICYDGYYPPRQ